MLNLRFAGTVETSAECGKEAQDLWVWVAFDRYALLVAVLLELDRGGETDHSAV